MIFDHWYRSPVISQEQQEEPKGFGVTINKDAPVNHLLIRVAPKLFRQLRTRDLGQDAPVHSEVTGAPYTHLNNPRINAISRTNNLCLTLLSRNLYSGPNIRHGPRIILH